MTNTTISGLAESLTGNIDQEFPINDSGVTRKIKLGTMITTINSANGVDGVATAVPLPTNTYNNGTSGVGATLVATANAALVVDGVTVTLGMSVLVKNEAIQANNGLYTVSNTGSSTTPYTLTRSTLMNTPAQFAGAVVVVGPSGAANANSFWVCAPYGPVVVGITSIAFYSTSAQQTGTSIIGSTSNNYLTITPGLTPSSPIVLTESGTGGIEIGSDASNQGITGSLADGATLSIANVTVQTSTGFGLQTLTAAQIVPIGLNGIVFNTKNGNANFFGSGTFGGTLISGGAKLSTSGASATLDTGGYIASLATTAPASAGSSVVVGDRFYDAYGNTYTAVAVTNGSITTVSLDGATPLFGTPPANPINLTAIVGVGTGVQVFLNWTEANTLQLNPTGNTVVGTGVAGGLADTENYLLIPFCAGAPTGVPANASQGAAIRYDTTNNKLWAYNNALGAWKSVAFS